MFGVETIEKESPNAAFALSADQHDQRRCDGLPTVSTLVGPAALGQRMWRAWAAQHDRSTAVVTGGPESGWHESWVATLLNDHNLYVDAENFVAPRLQKPIETIHNYLWKKTLHELNLIFERAQLQDTGMGPERLCRWLLLRRMSGKPLTAGELVRTQASWVDSVVDGAAALFQQLIELLRYGDPPTLLVMPKDLSAESSTPEGRHLQTELLHASAKALAQLAVHVPRLTVGLAVDEGPWTTYVRRGDESFANTLIRENVIRIAGSSPGQVQLEAASRGTQHVDALEQLLDGFEEIETSAKDLKSHVDASAIPQVKSIGEQNAWKSEQERFLFDLLEHTSDLSGLFKLNVDPGFRFGNRPAEIDLACLDLKIAIEIDGHHHFTDADHYRRDRRKDLTLQQHGYLVLRFLAEDVVPDMHNILETVRATVKFRRARIHS